MEKTTKLSLSMAILSIAINAHALNSNQITIIGKMKQEAIEVSKQEAITTLNMYGMERCDPIENPEIIELKFGTITATIGNHYKIVSLQSPIPALTAVVKLRCVNKIQAQKTDMYYQTILGLDEEFNMWRCRAATNITEFDQSGNNAIGYKIDHSHGKPNQIAELKNDCNFKIVNI